MKKLSVITVLLALLGGAAVAQPTSGTVITVIAHDSFAYSESVMDAFTEQTGIGVEVIRLGDAGSLVNQSILSRSNPLGDVLFGVDNTFLSRALDADIFIPYRSPEIERVIPGLRPSDDDRVTPITFGDVCLNYDAAFFAETGLDLPQNLADLTQPEYRSLLAVQNPALSSPGLAFLLLTVAVFGEESEYTYLDFWADLVENDVYVSPDWTDAYYNQFSGSQGSPGTRPLVVSYASSPPAEVYFLDERPETAPTGAIVAPQMCFRQIEYAGILNGSDQVAEAGLFIDFLLSRTFQEDMPLTMFVFPVVVDAELPDVFVEYAQIAEDPVRLDPALIEDRREQWIEAWTETVLRSGG